MMIVDDSHSLEQKFAIFSLLSMTMFVIPCLHFIFIPDTCLVDRELTNDRIVCQCPRYKLIVFLSVVQIIPNYLICFVQVYECNLYSRATFIQITSDVLFGSFVTPYVLKKLYSGVNNSSEIEHGRHTIQTKCDSFLSNRASRDDYNQQMKHMKYMRAANF